MRIVKKCGKEALRMTKSSESAHVYSPKCGVAKRIKKRESAGGGAAFIFSPCAHASCEIVPVVILLLDFSENNHPRNMRKDSAKFAQYLSGKLHRGDFQQRS